MGVCTAKQGEKLLGQNGKPLSTAVEISFPGQVENLSLIHIYNIRTKFCFTASAIFMRCSLTMP